MSEPTLKDIHRAGTWLNAAFGDQATAGVVESLAWLIADVRAEQTRQTLDLVRDSLDAGIPMGTGLPNGKAEDT